MKGGMTIRSSNRKRSLIVSSSVILLCMAIVIGLTYALFTDQRNVFHHLQSGDLKISLWRTNLEKTGLQANGYLDTVSSDEIVDFTDPTNRNLFDCANDKIVPGCKYVATMKLANLSDVAFGYWIEIVCTDQSKGEDLAKQLKVTVNTDKDDSAFVNDGLIVRGENGGYIGELATKNDQSDPWSTTFTVTLEFVDSFIDENGLEYGDNNLAKNESLSFDVVVHAVQVTEAQ